MSKMKSYWVHLSTAHKVVMILIPILMVIFQAEGLLLLEVDVIPYALAILLMADILTDYFTFGGMYAKDGRVQNFYKISPKGKSVYLNVFVIHAIRRILLYFGYTLISTAMVFLFGKEEFSIQLGGMTLAGYWIGVLGCAFGAYAYSIWGSFLCRKFDMFMVSFVIAIWGTSFMMIYNLIRMWSSEYVKLIILLVFLVCSVAGTALVLWYDRKKLEDSYYDEKSFKRNQSGV